MDPTRRHADAVTARLGLWDATSIIVGIIIGVGIFETPGSIFAKVPGPWAALGVWALGGAFALAGALCFAELASTYPRSGGEYVYLTRSFGALVGYLFAWAQFAVIRPGSIGALAYVFALYASNLWHFGPHTIVLLAVLAVLFLTAINVLGVTLGTTAQHLLTVAKVIGLAAIIGVGLRWGSWDNVVASAHRVDAGWFEGTMIVVLWTYAGWHEAAYVAAEIRDGPRNIPKALFLGTLAVTVIYLLVNFAYLMGTGLAVADDQILAADVMALLWPGLGGRAISLLIMISALGAINGMIFTTARMFAEFGVEHPVFRPLTHWSRSWGTPVRALAAQGIVSAAMIVGVALILNVAGARKGLETMIGVTAAVFWGFFFLTGVSLFILRHKDVGLPRVFRVPFYPVLPLAFCGCCGYMVFGAIYYDWKASLIGVGLLSAGLPFYYVRSKREPAALANEPVLEPVGSGAELHV